MIGSTWFCRSSPCVFASHETTPIEITYAIPAAASAISGASTERR